MNAEKIEDIVFELNDKIADHNEKSKDMEISSTFTFETNGYYSVIAFGEEIMWDSDNEPREWIEETNEYEDLQTYVQKRFNQYVNTLKKFRFNAPVNENLDGFEPASEILEDINSRSGLGNAWDSIDSDTQDEIFQQWVNIIEKHN